MIEKVKELDSIDQAKSLKINYSFPFYKLSSNCVSCCMFPSRLSGSLQLSHFLPFYKERTNSCQLIYFLSIQIPDSWAVGDFPAGRQIQPSLRKFRMRKTFIISCSNGYHKETQASGYAHIQYLANLRQANNYEFNQGLPR